MVRRPVDEFTCCRCPMMLLLNILPVVVVSKTGVQEVVKGGADVLVINVKVGRSGGKMNHRGRWFSHLIPHSGSRGIRIDVIDFWECQFAFLLLEILVALDIVAR